VSCAFPPEVDRIDLLAYLDGEADEEVARHLARCAYCRGRALALARVEGRLVDALYRVTCPDPQELGEFQLGRLSRTQRAAIRRHVAECPHCAREVAQLEGYLGSLSGELGPGPLERLRVLVAQLISGPALAPMGQPALAGVRGGARGPAIYQAEEIQIALETEEDEARPGSWVLLGLVTGAPTERMLVQVWQAGRRVGRGQVDSLGNLIIAGLASGIHEIRLSGAEVEIRIPEFPI
jgi:anti-sigma factor RsiW